MVNIFRNFSFLDRYDFMMKILEKLQFRERIKKNKGRRERRKTAVKNVLSTTYCELKHEFNELVSNPEINNIARFYRDVVGSGTWVVNYGLKYLDSLTDFSLDRKSDLDNQINRYIIEKVSKAEIIDDPSIGPEQIFRSIYKEIEYAHQNPQYQLTIKVPTIKTTTVLISGVFNELFKTAAFQRGVEHICNNQGNKFIVTEVSGLKNSHDNARAIEDQLKSYIKLHPTEKLWILAYSKGGIDVLHFLLNNSIFAQEYIKGVSMIAVPILGSEHFNKKRVKLTLGALNKIPNKHLQNFLKDRGRIFSMDFWGTLDAQYRQSWFQKHHEKLPPSLFYTALALHSDWSESHLWMRMTKVLLPNQELNDGIVQSRYALFPHYFKGINLGMYKGHHLVGSRSSSYTQEALIESLIIFLHYMGLLY